jgi:hypothetical protein
MDKINHTKIKTLESIVEKLNADNKSLNERLETLNEDFQEQQRQNKNDKIMRTRQLIIDKISALEHLQPLDKTNSFSRIICDYREQLFNFDNENPLIKKNSTQD